MEPVVFEFSRTNNPETFKKRVEFFSDWFSVIPERAIQVSVQRELYSLCNAIPQKASYVDYRLYCALKQFPSAFLITGNHSDFPLNFLEREHIITIDQKKDQITNLGFYRFNQEKFNLILDKMPDL